MIVWPGLRRSVSAISRLFNSAAFDAPLTHSAIPTRAASGTTGTFTRATTATVRDNEGVLRTAIAGEARFEGARRVDNLIRLGAAQSSTLAVAANVTMTLPAGAYQFSMGAGTGRVTFSGTGGATGTLDAVTTGRVHVAKTITAGTLIVTASVATLVDIQVVSMVAETDQTTIREYVSVGVASSPYYHGSMVDGVKCFATDINGSPIPSSTLLGYLAEGARTNLCLQSQTFDSWTDSGASVTANTTVAQDGTTTADTIVRVSGQGDARFVTPTLVSNAVHAVSLWIKKGTSPSSLIALYDVTAVTYRLFADVTWSGTTPVFAFTSGSLIRSTEWANGLWRIELLTEAVVAANTNRLYIYPGRAGSANGETVIAWGAQVELGSFASSYIPTTTLAVARNADVLTYSSAGNISSTEGWMYAEVTNPNSTTCEIITTYPSGSGGVFGGDLGKLALYDGTAFRLGDTWTTHSTPTKVAATYGSAGIRTAQSGVVSSLLTFDGNLNAGSLIGVGNYTSGAGNSLFGTVRNVRLGQRQLSTSEQGAITA